MTKRTIMKNTKLELSQQELLLLVSLVSDQLFRREFIDPKMPGFKGDPSELAMGKQLLLRLKSEIRQTPEPDQPASKRQTSHLSAATDAG